MTSLRGDEPDLGLGDSGEHVQQLQDRLRGLRLFDGLPDGSFDERTATAVRQLQSELGLTPDGQVGAQTWEALDRRLLDAGLPYDPGAGVGNQVWDRPAVEVEGAEQESDEHGNGEHESTALAVGQLSEDGYYRWNGADWETAQGGGGSGGDGSAGGGQLSEDGRYRWTGTDWEPTGESESAGAEDEQAPVVPHIDNIHPAIAGDERFSSFHDFLREHHGS